MNCEKCLESRPVSSYMVYCRMYGIVISRTHGGCIYQQRKEKWADEGTTGGTESEKDMDG